MVSSDLQVGDPVWAKMKGYPAWPAKIVVPPSDSKTARNKKARYVLFFGTGDYAWILNENIIPHSESMLVEAKSKKKTTVTYQNGIDELISYSNSFKRPKIIRKDKITNNIAKSESVFNSSSKNYNRNITNALLKKAKKKSYDLNGQNSVYSAPKYRKFSTKLSPIRDLTYYDLYKPPFERTKVKYRNSKHPKPSNLSFGFIGLGMMGKQIVKNLMESGHNITVYNKTSSQCDIFVDMGAKRARYTGDLIINCDVTFCCVSDPEAVKNVLYGDHGVVYGLEQVDALGLGIKGFVQMTNLDPHHSQRVCETVLTKHALYLEAALCGTSKDAEEGNLLILAAGDRKLFTQCETCFHAIGRNAYYVSCDVGDGFKLNLSIAMISSTVCATLAEAMVLIERLKLPKSCFLDLLKNGPLNCSGILEKAEMMDQLSFQKVKALKHAQTDLSLGLTIGNECEQRLPIIAVANEVYKHGRLRNYSNEDMSAVYKVIKY